MSDTMRPARRAIQSAETEIEWLAMQAVAILALAEEQRTANLLALAAIDGPHEGAPWRRLASERMGLT